MKSKCVLCSVILLPSCLIVNAPCPRACDEPGTGAEAGENGQTASMILMSMQAPQNLADQPSGFLLGSPTGFTAKTNAAIQLVDAGFDGGWTPEPGQPDFATFTQEWLSVSSVTEAPIQAMSLGIDVIEVKPVELDTGDSLDGAQLLAKKPVALASAAGSHAWMAFQFSVDYAQVGPIPPTAPDVLDAWSQGSLGPLDRTVFSFLVPDSTAAMLPFEWESVAAMRPDKLGLAPGDEIHGLSMHMALYGTDLARYHDVFTTRALPEKPTIYFTLRPAFLLAISGNAPSWVGASPDSGTIYRSSWDGRKWHEPTLFLTWQQMGIPAFPQLPPVIDGLSLWVPPNNGPIEILFSLADLIPPVNNPNLGMNVPAEEQIQYVVVVPGDPEPGRPMRVVIQPTPAGYASLGKQMGAGRGIGDFCTKDPVALTRQLYPALLDDFFVARRLPPTQAHIVPPRLVRGHTIDWSQVALPIELPGQPKIPKPWLPRPITDRSLLPQSPKRIERPRLLNPPVLVLHPHVQMYLPTPELALAVASYRRTGAGVATMRTCMSWPRPIASEGVATVRWGRMDDYLADPATPGAILWDPPRSMPYHGAPLADDLPLPRSAVQVGTMQALVAQWTLTAGGRLYTSPISQLRY